MALAYIDGERIRLRSEWRERELAKEAGCRWDDDAGTWWTTLSWATCVMLRGVFGEHLEIGQDLSDWAAQEIETRIKPCMELRQRTEPVSVYGSAGFFENRALEPLQTTAVAFAATAERCLIGDGMGSGKSVEGICAVEELALKHGDAAVFPCLVVATNSMCYTWEDELAAWAPGRSVAVLKGGVAKRRKMIESRPDYMILNWEALASHTRLANYGSIAMSEKDKLPKELNEDGLIKTVLADEAHRGKNPKAKQTRAWWRVSWDASFSIAMTGTPAARYPGDLWAIMHGVAPREWPSKVAWTDRYAKKVWNLFGGLEFKGLRGDTQDELFKFLDPRFIRRPTKVVIPNIAEKLPPQIRYVDMTGKQATAYKQMKKEMIALLDGKDGEQTDFVMAGDHLASMTRLLQLSSSYLEIADDGTVRMVDPSCKVDAVMDLLDELDEDPLVVFAESKQLVDLTAARLERASIPYGIITGDVPELDRAQHVRRFQEGQYPIFLATMAAGGEGVTLTRARHVAYMQRSFSLIRNKQSEDRVWRRGQDRPVQPIWIVSRNTIERHVVDVGEERDVMFEEIVRDEVTLRKMLEL